MLEKIQKEMKQAMKDRNDLRTSVLRMLISELKYAQIEKRASLDEPESIQVLNRAIKKRKEAIEMYDQAGRADLAEKERNELQILQEFAPQQLDETTARLRIDEIILELGAKEKKDMGRVIKEVMARYRGQIDGKLVQKAVSERLG